MSNFSLSLVLGLVAALADVFGALILVRTQLGETLPPLLRRPGRRLHARGRAAGDDS